MLKIDESLARNIDFEVANFEVHKKTRRKTSILRLQSVKIGGCLARNVRFDAPTCLVSSLWFSCGLAVSMGEAAKPILFQGVKASYNVVLRGRRGASWHSHVSASVSKVVLCGGRQAQYFCVVFRRCVAVCVTGVALWRPPSSFCVASATLQTCRVACFCESQCQSCVTWWHPANSVAGVACFGMGWHSTLYTPHVTPYTPHSTLYS